jgi:hypothetical protein
MKGKLTEGTRARPMQTKRNSTQFNFPIEKAREEVYSSRALTFARSLYAPMRDTSEHNGFHRS